MMKKIMLSIIFAAFIGLVFADNDGNKAETPANAPVENVTLSGNVLDFQSGEQLAGVEIQIEGTDLKTYTDFDGNFEFSGVKPGTYNLIASYISYKNSLVENFAAKDAKEELTIKLQPSK
jgi:hypothetical protein